MPLFRDDPLPELATLLAKDWPQAIGNLGLVYRVVEPPGFSHQYYDDEKGFQADSEALEAGHPLPKGVSNEQRIKSLDLVARHIGFWKGKAFGIFPPPPPPITPWISTTAHPTWAIWEASRRQQHGVCIAVIDLHGLTDSGYPEPSVYYASDLLSRISPQNTSADLHGARRFANSAQEVLILGRIPTTAVLSIIPWEDLLRVIPALGENNMRNTIYRFPDEPALSFERPHNYIRNPYYTPPPSSYCTFRNVAVFRLENSSWGPEERTIHGRICGAIACSLMGMPVKALAKGFRDYIDDSKHYQSVLKAQHSFEEFARQHLAILSLASNSTNKDTLLDLQGGSDQICRGLSLLQSTPLDLQLYTLIQDSIMMRKMIELRPRIVSLGMVLARWPTARWEDNEWIDIKRGILEVIMGDLTDLFVERAKSAAECW